MITPPDKPQAPAQATSSDSDEAPLTGKPQLKGHSVTHGSGDRLPSVSGASAASEPDLDKQHSAAKLPAVFPDYLQMGQEELIGIFSGLITEAPQRYADDTVAEIQKEKTSMMRESAKYKERAQGSSNATEFYPHCAVDCQLACAEQCLRLYHLNGEATEVDFARRLIEKSFELDAEYTRGAILATIAQEYLLFTPPSRERDMVILHLLGEAAGTGRSLAFWQLACLLMGCDKDFSFSPDIPGAIRCLRNVFLVMNTQVGHCQQDIFTRMYFEPRFYVDIYSDKDPLWNDELALLDILWSINLGEKMHRHKSMDALAYKKAEAIIDLDKQKYLRGLIKVERNKIGAAILDFSQLVSELRRRAQPLTSKDSLLLAKTLQIRSYLMLGEGQYSTEADALDPLYESAALGLPSSLVYIGLWHFERFNYKAAFECYHRMVSEADESGCFTDEQKRSFQLQAIRCHAMIEEGSAFPPEARVTEKAQRNKRKRQKKRPTESVSVDTASMVVTEPETVTEPVKKEEIQAIPGTTSGSKTAKSAGAEYSAPPGTKTLKQAIRKINGYIDGLEFDAAFDELQIALSTFKQPHEQSELCEKYIWCCLKARDCTEWLAMKARRQKCPGQIIVRELLGEAVKKSGIMVSKTLGVPTTSAQDSEQIISTILERLKTATEEDKRRLQRFVSTLGHLQSVLISGAEKLNMDKAVHRKFYQLADHILQHRVRSKLRQRQQQQQQPQDTKVRLISEEEFRFLQEALRHVD